MICEWIWVVLRKEDDRKGVLYALSTLIRLSLKKISVENLVTCSNMRNYSAVFHDSIYVFLTRTESLFWISFGVLLSHLGSRPTAIKLVAYFYSGSKFTQKVEIKEIQNASSSEKTDRHRVWISKSGDNDKKSKGDPNLKSYPQYFPRQKIEFRLISHF